MDEGKIIAKERYEKAKRIPYFIFLKSRKPRRSGIVLLATKRLEGLHARTLKCRRCGLWKTRTREVPGEGPANAKKMFIGLSPRANEDIQSRSFVGRAGFCYHRKTVACIQ